MKLGTKRYIPKVGILHIKRISLSTGLKVAFWHVSVYYTDQNIMQRGTKMPWN